jgi:hypothetical protein
MIHARMYMDGRYEGINDLCNTTMKLMLVLVVIGLVSLQHLSILGNSFNSSIDNIGNPAFALVTSKPITCCTSRHG